MPLFSPQVAAGNHTSAKRAVSTSRKQSCSTTSTARSSPARTRARLVPAIHTHFTWKVYVQHRMLESGAEFWARIAQGAQVYVCGDAKRMAADVDLALAEIATRHGGLTREAAARHLKDLARAGRYQRDVY